MNPAIAQAESHPLARSRLAELPAAGGYESYYLKAASPDGGQAIWIRHTVHKYPGAAPTGSLWFTHFERGAARPFAVKQTFDSVSVPDGAGLLAIAGAMFGLGAVTGAAAGEGRSATWDLRCAGSGTPVLPLPARLYRSGLLKTKSLTLQPEASFDGRIEFDDRVVELNGWRGMIGHNWGRQHAETWVWLHGDGLRDERPNGVGLAWIDLVAGRLKFGRRILPWIGNGVLSIDGERFRLGGIGRMRSTSVDAAVGRCEIALRGAGVRARAEFEAPTSTIAVWRYADPDGSEHHAMNSSLSGLTVEVERSGMPPATLRTDSRAVYELGTRDTSHGLPVEPFPDG